jgi:putative addiction module component (TIGR02574 family)
VDLNTVLREVETWSVDDQVQLVQRLWDRLEDQGYEPELNDAQKAELDRRLAAYEENPGAGSSWEDVKSRVWSGS